MTYIETTGIDGCIRRKAYLLSSENCLLTALKHENLSSTNELEKILPDETEQIFRGLMPTGLNGPLEDIKNLERLVINKSDNNSGSFRIGDSFVNLYQGPNLKEIPLKLLKINKFSYLELLNFLTVKVGFYKTKKRHHQKDLVALFQKKGPIENMLPEFEEMVDWIGHKKKDFITYFLKISEGTRSKLLKKRLVKKQSRLCKYVDCKITLESPKGYILNHLSDRKDFGKVSFEKDFYK